MGDGEARAGEHSGGSDDEPTRPVVADPTGQPAGRGRTRLVAFGGLVLVMVAVGVAVVARAQGDSGGSRVAAEGVAGSIQPSSTSSPIVPSSTTVRPVSTTTSTTTSTSTTTTTVVPAPLEAYGPLPGSAFAHGAVWLPNGALDVVQRWALAEDDPVGDVEIAVGEDPAAIGVGAGSVWVASAGDDTVTRIDPATNELTAVVAVGRFPTGLVVNDEAVWVVNHGDDTVSRIDPASEQVVETISVGRHPVDAAIEGDALWVSNLSDGTISRVDLETRAVVETISVGTAPAGVGGIDGHVFVANSGDDTISILDAGTGAVKKTEPVRPTPFAVVTGEARGQSSGTRKTVAIGHAGLVEFTVLHAGSFAFGWVSEGFGNDTPGWRAYEPAIDDGRVMAMYGRLDAYGSAPQFRELAFR